MKKSRIQNRLTAILAGVFLVSPSAYTDSTMSNLASIEQVGNAYRAAISQSGDGNMVHVRQKTSGAQSDGILNEGNGTAEVIQTGSQHYAEINDFGEQNNITIQQWQSSNALTNLYGNNNQVDIGQSGDAQTIAAYINGSSNLINAYQSGSDNFAVIGIVGDANEVMQLQQGNGNTSGISIDGDNNTVIQQQLGDGLSFNLELQGSGKSITVEQGMRREAH